MAVLFHIGLLCFYKYRMPVLPPGISFYTFTLLSVDIDVYLYRERAPGSWLELGAYTAMFPKLLSGPITSYHAAISQVRCRKVSAKKIEYGLSLGIIGLASKVIIADTVGILWHDIRTAGFESISTPLAWMGAAAYSVQLLFDFQGYSLMALGLGSMLGFDLPRNFDHPYRSRSISEYYRRWHMSLGRWFRNYLYIPLGGSRKGAVRTAFHLLVVWLVTGIWHGVTPNFVLWGLILGTFIVLEKIWFGEFLNRHRYLSHLYVWFIIPLTWVIFAIPDFKELQIYFSRLFPFWSSGVTVNEKDWLYHGRNYLGFFLAALALSCPPADYLWKKYWNTMAAKTVLFALFWLCVYRLVNGSHNPFLYLSF
ncbi:MAG: MBOAT family protein [Lachnospiraceae bacterium]|nr:MBOAT family protein [Lachnospiraceae bacterium]